MTLMTAGMDNSTDFLFFFLFLRRNSIYMVFY